MNLSIAEPKPLRRILTAILCAALAGRMNAETGERYAGMLEQLRSEITAKLPPIDTATRQRIVEAKDTQARVEAGRKRKRRRSGKHRKPSRSSCPRPFLRGIPK